MKLFTNVKIIKQLHSCPRDCTNNIIISFKNLSKFIILTFMKLQKSFKISDFCAFEIFDFESFSNFQFRNVVDH